MAARLDFSRYNNGCKKLLNMVCTTQGPTTRRPGNAFIFDFNTIGFDVNNPLVRHIPFIFNELQSYAMVFYMHTDGKARVVFATQEGLVVYPDPVPEFCPPNPTFEAKYTGIGGFSSRAYTGNAAYPVGWQSDTQEERDQLVVAHIDDEGVRKTLIHSDDYTFTNNDNDITTNTSKVPDETNGTLYTYKYQVGTDIAAASEIKVVHDVEGGAETELVEGVDYTLTISTEYPYVPHGIEVTNGALTETDATLKVYKYTDASVQPGDIVSLTLPAGWDIENFDWAQSGDEVYIAQPTLPPHIIRRWGNTCWEIIRPAFDAQPDDWSDEYGWPERVTFHQQRLAFAANLLRRQTVWLSRAGDFNSFDNATGGGGSDTVDSDAITFTLDSGTQNKIIWMLSAKGLNVGTIGNEWTVVGATRTALTPSNVLAQRQTNHGGEQNKPLMVGITTLFVERHGRAINEFVYDFNVDSYKTSDMSVLASHFTDLYSIIDWTYQQTPDNVIWCVREDGALLGITYQRQHEVIGWHAHSTKGEFKAITSVPGSCECHGREDEVWTTVKRVVDGQDKYYLEKFAPQFLSGDTKDAKFLDSYSEYDGVATSVITGLDYLEGETVSVLADGTAHPDVVVSSGSITLNNEYSMVIVGLSYPSEVWPHLPDLGMRDGTTMGRMQRITNLDIDFYETLGIYIGRWDSEDGEQEEEHPFRVPGNLTGTAVPLFTGIKHISYPEGFDRQSTYFIRQKQPLPLTVRAVVDTIEVYE